MDGRGGAIAVLFACGALAGCGDEPTRYSDEKIIDRLHLEASEGGYAIDGDLFCLVERKLLNDSDEVEAAADRDEIGLVVASSEANAGVTGVAPFAQDCLNTARKRLNKLDPAPEEQ